MSGARSIANEEDAVWYTFGLHRRRPEGCPLMPVRTTALMLELSGRRGRDSARDGASIVRGPRERGERNGAIDGG